MVRTAERVAVGFGFMASENAALRAENAVLRQAVGDMQFVLEQAWEALGPTKDGRGDSAG